MKTFHFVQQMMRGGTPWVWLTSGCISIILLAALGLVGLITVKGLTYFWPQPLVQYQMAHDDHSINRLGLLMATKTRKLPHFTGSNNALVQESLIHYYDDVRGRMAFQWVDTQQTQFQRPQSAVVVKLSNGQTLLGYLTSSDKQPLTSGAADFETASAKQLVPPYKGDSVTILTASGTPIPLVSDVIIELYPPNTMGLVDKLGYFFTHFSQFISQGDFNENGQKGVFPAIFGTVFLVFLMTIMVAPLGVVAAIYLFEYAQNTITTRIIRIAVVNLAGVPSIVFGVFGLGFFVYFIGSGIDNAFYSESLPNPTFGEPGVLWSALTMALLTLPVVIVSTEEGLSRIPKNTKRGCVALGATRFETLYKVLLPMASPAIITGLILAIARAAGEVAPLMLVGVVKSAPTLPVDGTFPFIHLDRQFMHLGFEIFDSGFQSPNMDSSAPLVYATAMLLILVILMLNITAVSLRNHLSVKYQAMLD